MFLPLRKNLVSEHIKVKDKTEKDIHLDLILTQNNLLELIERQLIHSETDKICENSQESPIIFTISTRGKLIKDEVISYFKKSPIPLTAIEYLLHKNPFCILALKLSEKFLSVRIRSHFVLIECVDKKNAFFDQLRIFHMYGLLLL